MSNIQNIFFLSGGTTLHSAFKLGKFGTKYQSLSDKPLAELRENLADLKLVIIDEISLVSADMLYTIHMRLNEVFQTNNKVDLFANVNMIVVGDLLQLRPVQGTYIFKTPLNLKYQANKDTLELWNSFKPMILAHNHRQGEENEWADALNEFRVGIVSERGKSLLEERQTSDALMDEDTMHIIYRNIDVKNHNDKMLNSLPAPLVTIRAVQALPRGVKSTTDPERGTIGKTQFMENLRIKIGARVTVIFNVNVIDDLVNGSYGRVIGIKKTKEGKVQCIIVKFDDDWTGIEQRRKYAKYLTDEEKAQNGTPIFRMEHEYELVSRGGHGQTSRAKLLQFPLSLSYAQTCHRMQGQTVKAETKVNIHWTNGMQNGMAYVMLGRSVRRQDIYISGKLDPSQIRCDPDALEESKRLSKEFDDREAELAEKRSKVWKISYLNVRSLNAHCEDVRKDNFLIDSDILGLGETHQKDEEVVPLDEFFGVFANFGKGKGVAGYTKMDLQAEPCIVKSNSYSAILLKTHHFTIIFLYLSNNYDKTSVFTLLDKWIEVKTPTAVIGDVNENILAGNSQCENFMRGKGFYQMVDQPTRHSGTLIDHIYVNDALDQIGFSTQVDACYYSDHDIISMYVTK